MEKKELEVKHFIIPKEGMHIFEFEGTGVIFSTHSSTLLTAWEEWFKNNMVFVNTDKT
jgi:hypothetical protein